MTVFVVEACLEDQASSQPEDQQVVLLFVVASSFVAAAVALAAVAASISTLAFYFYHHASLNIHQEIKHLIITEDLHILTVQIYKTILLHNYSCHYGRNSSRMKVTK